jgi:hypothetical protein
LIKKLRKLSPILKSGSKLPRVGATRKKKKYNCNKLIIIPRKIKVSVNK